MWPAKGKVIATIAIGSGADMMTRYHLRKQGFDPDPGPPEAVTARIQSEVQQWRALVAKTGADVLIVAAYGLILPQAVLDIPRRGCLNIHASLLPRWPLPVNWRWYSAPRMPMVRCRPEPVSPTVTPGRTGIPSGSPVSAMEPPAAWMIESNARYEP